MKGELQIWELSLFVQVTTADLNETHLQKWLITCMYKQGQLLNLK